MASPPDVDAAANLATAREVGDLDAAVSFADASAADPVLADDAPDGEEGAHAHVSNGDIESAADEHEDLGRTAQVSAEDVSEAQGDAPEVFSHTEGEDEVLLESESGDSMQAQDDVTEQDQAPEKPQQTFDAEIVEDGALEEPSQGSQVQEEHESKLEVEAEFEPLPTTDDGVLQHDAPEEPSHESQVQEDDESKLEMEFEDTKEAPEDQEEESVDEFPDGFHPGSQDEGKQRELDVEDENEGPEELARALEDDLEAHSEEESKLRDESPVGNVEEESKETVQSEAADAFQADDEAEQEEDAEEGRLLEAEDIDEAEEEKGDGNDLDTQVHVQEKTQPCHEQRDNMEETLSSVACQDANGEDHFEAPTLLEEAFEETFEGKHFEKGDDIGRNKENDDYDEGKSEPYLQAGDAETSKESKQAQEKEEETEQEDAHFDEGAQFEDASEAEEKVDLPMPEVVQIEFHVQEIEQDDNEGEEQDNESKLQAHAEEKAVMFDEKEEITDTATQEDQSEPHSEQQEAEHREDVESSTEPKVARGTQRKLATEPTSISSQSPGNGKAERKGRGKRIRCDSEELGSWAFAQHVLERYLWVHHGCARTSGTQNRVIIVTGNKDQKRPWAAIAFAVLQAAVHADAFVLDHAGSKGLFDGISANRGTTLPDLIGLGAADAPRSNCALHRVTIRTKDCASTDDEAFAESCMRFSENLAGTFKVAFLHIGKHLDSTTERLLARSKQDPSRSWPTLALHDASRPSFDCKWAAFPKPVRGNENEFASFVHLHLTLDMFAL